VLIPRYRSIQEWINDGNFIGAQLATSLNGGTVALKEIVDLAAMGRIKSLVDRYPLSAVKQAYDDFEHKRLVGRAVLIPTASQTAGESATDSSRIVATTGV